MNATAIRSATSVPDFADRASDFAGRTAHQTARHYPAPDWLWPQRIPARALTLVAGGVGSGKSFLACDLAARISRGAPWPDTLRAAPAPQPVLLLTHEITTGYAPLRLQAASADLQRIELELPPDPGPENRTDPAGADAAATATSAPVSSGLDMIAPDSGVRASSTLGSSTPDADEPPPVFQLSRDLDRLEAFLDRRRDIRVVIIDSLTWFLGADGPAKLRVSVARLADLARRKSLTIIATIAYRSRPRLNRELPALGDAVVVTQPQVIWSLELPDDVPTSERVLRPIKLNQIRDTTLLRFAITSGKLDWSQAFDVVNQLLSAPPAPPPPQTSQPVTTGTCPLEDRGAKLPEAAPSSSAASSAVPLSAVPLSAVPLSAVPLSPVPLSPATPSSATPLAAAPPQLQVTSRPRQSPRSRDLSRTRPSVRRGGQRPAAEARENAPDAHSGARTARRDAQGRFQPAGVNPVPPARRAAQPDGPRGPPQG